MACFLGYAETLSILLERGADLETNNDRDEGALHMACRGGQMECFDAVVACGGKADKVSMDDQTPLHVAARLGHVEMVEKLVKAGANIEATANSYSALAIAAKENYLDAAEVLVENGANVIDVNFDAALIDGEACMSRFLNLVASEPDIARVPIMIDSSKWSVIEEGLKVAQGKCIINSTSLKAGEETFLRHARCAMQHGAALVRTAGTNHSRRKVCP